MITIGNSTYDETFKSGDLISMYGKGFYKFVRYEERRGNNTPLVWGIIQYNSAGKPVKPKEYTCDASWCAHAVVAIRAVEEQLHQLHKMVLKAKV